MSAILTAPSSMGMPRSARSESVNRSAANQADPTSVDSRLLLQGHKVVTITHNGVLYRLQATKLGKLILTK